VPSHLGEVGWLSFSGKRDGKAEVMPAVRQVRRLSVNRGGNFAFPVLLPRTIGSLPLPRNFQRAAFLDVKLEAGRRFTDPMTGRRSGGRGACGGLLRAAAHRHEKSETNQEPGGKLSEARREHQIHAETIHDGG